MNETTHNEILKGFQQCYLDILRSDTFFSIQFSYLCYLDIIEIWTFFSIQFNIFVLHLAVLSSAAFGRAREIISSHNVGNYFL